MARSLGLVYGCVCYLIGFGSLAYAILFLNNLLVPRTIDAGSPAPMGIALVVNLGLAGLFAVQHSLMARASFKRALTRWIPAFSERSTYVLCSGLALIALYAFWQPLPQAAWAVETPALRVTLHVLQALGWVWLVSSTFMLDHFELFGIKQVVANARGEALPAMRFRTPGFYRLVRHPIQLGVLVSFWATPDMSVGRLLLCVLITGYILVALTVFEERDLVRSFGSDYTRYQRRVGMLMPRLRRQAAEAAGEPALHA